MKSIRRQKKKNYDIYVQLSRGYATYDPAKDKEYGDVFRRAEADMKKKRTEKNKG